ncbi:MAG: tetratricopeptide repeat protein [Deltaproteobacteria bacterium]|nr:tetratricopeptide repeat protein [Deltaproteobacteria bacterium]
MRKQLRRVDAIGKGSPASGDGPPPDGRGDGFALRFAGGRGILWLGKTRLSPAVTVDRLELVIPNISFPFDISSGIAGFKNRRHALGRITLTISIDGLEDMARRRLLAAPWIANVRLAFERDHLCVLADCGPEGDRVPLSFRLYPAPGDASLGLVVEEPRAYGPLPACLLVAVAACLEALLGTRPAATSLDPPDPVRHALFELLPRRGWRLPDTSSARLLSLDLLPDRAVLDYGQPDLVDVADAPRPAQQGAELDRLKRIEEGRLVRSGDLPLVAGRIEEARQIYGRLLAEDPDSPVVIGRLAMVDALDPDRRGTARSLLAESRGRHAARTDLAAVAAHAAALDRDVEAEVEALEVLYAAGDGHERWAAGLRMGRLLAGRDPTGAVRCLTGALAARRESPEAMAALMEAEAAQGRADAVGKLLPRFIAAHKGSAERVAAHVFAGRLLLDRLRDAAGAARQFERAALADPRDWDAAWGLAESLARLGNAERAVVQFERLMRTAREAGDDPAAARALKEIGDIWLEKAEAALAVSRYREALALDPDAAPVRVRLSLALRALDRTSEAANELEAALRGAGPACKEPWWGNAAHELARLYVYDLKDVTAARPWIEAALGFESEAKDAVSLLLLEGRLGDDDAALSCLRRARELSPADKDVVAALEAHLTRRGLFADLASLLAEQAVAATDGKRVAELEIRIADLMAGPLDDPKAAANALMYAFEADPSCASNPTLADRATTLADSLANGDTEELFLLAKIAAALGRVHYRTLNDPARALSWLERSLDALPDQPDVLLDLADCAWDLGEDARTARSLERLRVVAPERSLGPIHWYRLAHAMAVTGGWSEEDVLETLVAALPGLAGKDRDDALHLAAVLRCRLGHG